MEKAPFAALRMRRRRIPLFPLFRIGRILGILLLLCALGVGGIRYIQRTASVLALAFNQHVVGQATGAVGVLGVAVADMQSDGREDIVTAGLDGVKVYIQQQSGGFEQKIVEELRAERLIVRDLNKDGAPDIVVTVDANPSLKVYINQGDVEFTKTSIGTGSKAAVAVGDLDGDGAVDLATSLQQSEVYVLQRWMNNGAGTFTATTLASDTGVRAVAIADIDGNGFNDIITGGSKGLQGWDTNNGTIWSREDIDTSQTSFTTLTTGDVNADGGVDIVAGDQGNNTVTYFRHLQHSAYEKVVVSSSVDASTVKIVDLNEDGATDILAVSQDENTVYWFKNDGKDSFTRNTIATNLQSVFGVAVSDFDNDGDFDFTAGDHVQGTVYWYERVHAKPVATAPSAIAQMTDGSGRIVFTTEVSQADSARTRLRVEYSLDGKKWHKAYISKATPSKGKVDVTHDNPYQIGTVNPIDTDVNDTVKLTITWDTKSTKNVGGAITADASSVRLRLTPRDPVGNGLSTTSSAFRVDNEHPKITGVVSVSSTQEDTATLTWKVASDGNLKGYRVYYGTDRTKVSDQKSSQWKSEQDSALANSGTTTTTITGLSSGSTYVFKLIARDAFGNESAWPVVSELLATPSPTPTPLVTPEETGETTPTPDVTQTPSVLETPELSVTPAPSLSPTETPLTSATVTPIPTPPPTTFDNLLPIADAGVSEVVSPSALVILEGGASTDPDGSVLTYSWKQISGAAVDLLSSRTANPSFSAKEGGPYIFQLTVKDDRGASSTDLVTIAVRSLPRASTLPVAIVSALPATPIPTSSSGGSSVLISLLRPANLILFIAAIVLTLLLVIERAAHSLRGGKTSGSSVFAPQLQTPRGRVVHYRTGVPLAGVQVMIYGSDGKLRSTDRTNEQGEFSSLFPAGEYTIGVHAPGFIFAGGASHLAGITQGLIYTGGQVSVTDPTKPLDIAIPMKPSTEEATSLTAKLLPVWQALQYLSRILSWPVFILGAFVNTTLVFLQPGFALLGVEVMYVVLIIVKVMLEVRVRPAYGLVRDAITHVPLDLAVVRLFDQKTNRLIMTRVANSQGKFFALPPSGTYMITVTKPGYAPFSRDNVTIESAEDSVLQMTADLMPAAPQAAFAGLAGGVI